MSAVTALVQPTWQWRARTSKAAGRQLDGRPYDQLPAPAVESLR